MLGLHEVTSKGPSNVCVMLTVFGSEFYNNLHTKSVIPLSGVPTAVVHFLKQALIPITSKTQSKGGKAELGIINPTNVPGCVDR